MRWFQGVRWTGIGGSEVVLARRHQLAAARLAASITAPVASHQSDPSSAMDGRFGLGMERMTSPGHTQPGSRQSLLLQALRDDGMSPVINIRVSFLGLYGSGSAVA